MSIADKLEKLNTDITNFYAAIAEKNGTIPENKNTENLVAALDTIKTSLVVIPPEAGNLTGIMITKYPNKLDYKEGESFDSTGLEVISTYDNGVTGIVTGDCTLVGEDPLKTTTTKVTVQYEGFEATISIRVYGEFPEIPPDTKFLLHLDGSPINTITGTTDYLTGYILTTTSYIECKFGKGINNVGNIYINDDNTIDSGIPTYAELLNGSKNLSISFWACVTSTGNTDNIMKAMVENRNSYNYYCFHFNVSDQHNVKAGVHDTSGVAYTSISYPVSENLIGTWHHYAVTFTGGKVYFFFDGKKIHEATPISGSKDENSLVIMFPKVCQRLDEILITTSALWTADFTPPTQPYGGSRILTGLKFQTQPSKIKYLVGETFSLDGAKLIATYSDGSNIDVTNICEISNKEPLSLGDTIIEFKYTDGEITKDAYICVTAYKIDEKLDLSETKLLLPFDANSDDLIGNNIITKFGNDFYSNSSLSKFGQSKYFNGSNVYLTLPYNDNINFDTGDFTIAFWAYDLGGTSQRDVVTCYKNYSDGGFLGGFRIGVFSKRTDMYCALFKADGTNFEVVPTYTAYLHTNEWAHYALVRSGDTFTFYENGVAKGSYVYDGALHNSTKLVIGARDVSTSASENFSYFFNGYIDDFILTKSALWTSGFTPPSRPFADIVEK